jgi:hypothetical protein
MARLISVPGGSQLWYDARDISFLQEDERDAADILSVQAAAVNSLITAGFDADSVVEAVDSGDLTRLKHSGLYSVQLRPAGADDPVMDATTNGAPASTKKATA